VWGIPTAKDLPKMSKSVLRIRELLFGGYVASNLPVPSKVFINN
jgi:hypothetical protein